MVTEQILVGRSACQGCVIACGRVVNLRGDKIKRKGPEHETMVGFGANLLNDNLESIVDLGELCDRLGMDTISTSNTIGLAFHLYELGILTKEDTGVELKWGNVDAIEELVRLIGSRDGIGDLLAQGSRRFAAHYGVEEEAVQVNGLEVAYHDPRGVSGMAISYATSPRGACHNNSDYFFVDFGHSHEELGIEFMSRHAQAEKAASVARHQDWRTIDNAIVMCIFANVEAKEKAALLNAACGLDWSVDDMMKFGERSWNLKRAINNRMGLTRANDKLPKALLTPLAEGGSEGFVPDIDGMLSAYYEARGWDEQTGKPNREKLIELRLDDIANDLWN
jgi:aldehyde:ferredoxin oxidoreductase